jgi:hypothetical protein
MPLQDLTPELRTRLSRVERRVGWFVILATGILLVGFAYYFYATAQSRGWFVTKINYATALNDAAGFKVGNLVKLMGFDVGEITQINLNSPELSHGLTIFFPSERHITVTFGMILMFVSCRIFWETAFWK